MVKGERAIKREASTQQGKGRFSGAGRNVNGKEALNRPARGYRRRVTEGEVVLPRRNDKRARGQVAEPLVALRRKYGYPRRQAAEEQRVRLDHTEQRPDEGAPPAAAAARRVDHYKALKVLAWGARPERLGEEEVAEVVQAESAAGEVRAVRLQRRDREEGGESGQKVVEDEGEYPGASGVPDHVVTISASVCRREADELSRAVNHVSALMSRNSLPNAFRWEPFSFYWRASTATPSFLPAPRWRNNPNGRFPSPPSFSPYRLRDHVINHLLEITDARENGALAGRPVTPPQGGAYQPADLLPGLILFQGVAQTHEQALDHLRRRDGFPLLDID